MGYPPLGRLAPGPPPKGDRCAQCVCSVYVCVCNACRWWVFGLPTPGASCPRPPPQGGRCACLSSCPSMRMAWFWAPPNEMSQMRYPGRRQWGHLGPSQAAAGDNDNESRGGHCGLHAPGAGQPCGACPGQPPGGLHNPPGGSVGPSWSLPLCVSISL